MKDVEVTYPGDGIAVVALHGEHDCATKDEMAALLAREVSRNDLVAVDVSEATFIDSSFLHNLSRAHRAATNRETHFVLQMGTAHIVRKALEISGLLHSLDVAHTRDEAVSRRAARTEPPNPAA